MPPKKKNGRKAPKNTKSMVPRLPRSISNRLDEQAMCYARLLNDPCSAPLCHPTFAGADGGMVVRCENTIAIGTAAGSTASVFSWTPGAIGLQTASGNGTAIVTGEATSAGGAITLGRVSAGFQPGYLFLSTTAAEVRCVAACIQVFVNGTEANRAGIVGYGNAIGGALVDGQAVNANGTITMLEHFGRSPVDHLEVKWRPTNFDQNYTQPTSQTPTQESARRGALAVAQQGSTGGTGITIRMVAVYEYTPLYALGLTNNVASRNTSNNTLDQVINFLDQTGDWVVRGTMAAARLAGAVAGASPYVRAISYGGRRAAQVMLN